MMRLALVFLFAAAAPLPARAAEDDLRIQQYLEGLMLGDTMRQIQVVFPKKGDWPKSRELSTKLDRLHILPGTAKYFPDNMDEIDLGMRLKAVSSIRIVYDKSESRRKPLNEVVIDYSLIYGEPRRHEETYFWYDRGTVLAIYHQKRGDDDAPRSRGRSRTESAELRVVVELMDRKYFKPLQ